MRRRTLLAVIAAGLTVGVMLGLTSERWAPLMALDALSIFDGEPSGEDRWTSTNFAANSILATRRIATLGDTEIFAVRSTVDMWSGMPHPEGVLCVSARSPRLVFFSTGCVSETVFREHGLRGVLSAIEQPSGFPTWRTERLITVVWSPTGEVTVVDLTDEVVLSPDELYSEEERAVGLDIPFIDTLRFTGADPDVSRLVAESVSLPELGPGEIGRGSDSGVTTTTYLSVHAGATADAERSVCLTVRFNDELLPPVCDSLATFRESGITLQLVDEGVTLFARPREGVGFDVSARETR
ncbi:hypothetical protein EV140_1141 [Microcella alkaliphila]|uniref:Uncharacterized protein n=1 Tax=Microcella alkaliphila TaxID=279828 RepID=A0A4Q7TQV1_9MICO|nr:hypothetical protein [Microcella alkaliphila]RZT62607.1 hypothetical protein EV140_1141 [Microcella alkaliphila]